MSSIASNAHIRCRFNNAVDINTWAEDDPPYLVETDDFTEVKKGQDGKYYVYNRADFGGMLTIHLAPYAPAVRWLIQRVMARDNNLLTGEGGEIFTCTLKDVSRGGDWTMSGGTLTHAPKMMNPNQTYTARFTFERIISNVDAAKFGARFDPLGQ